MKHNLTCLVYYKIAQKEHNQDQGAIKSTDFAIQHEYLLLLDTGGIIVVKVCDTKVNCRLRAGLL